MLFNSIPFLLFFVIVFIVFYLLAPRFRWMWLLPASCFFYMYWKPQYLLLLAVPAIIDYSVALQMAQTADQKKRTFLLWISLVSNLGLLFFFKYYNFFLSNLLHLPILGPQVGRWMLTDLVLPVGISFYTFQTLSYTIDVYRRQIEPEKHPGKFMLFVTFFPQLVAGPIERAGHLLPQIRKLDARLNDTNFIGGFSRITYGLFKKVVVADTLAQLVDAVYNNYPVQSGCTLLIATWCFAIQIYCDFSGYSDIAVGTAQMLGVQLMENFKLPYFADSITSFWRRWHISLSSWLRDYLYIPLGGNRQSSIFTYRNLMITMLLGGLWHGASWTFIIWGGLHGFYLAVERFLGIRSNDQLSGFKNSGLWRFFRIMLTFQLLSLTWIFFRSGTIEQAITILQKIAGFRLEWTGPYISILFVCILLISILLAFEWGIFRKYSFRDLIEKMPYWFWIIWNVFLILMLLILGVSDGSQFIYFQF